MRDVASHAGVGTMTVSRVLRTPEQVSTELRERVLAAIDAVGFIRDNVASSMRSESRVLGTIVPPLINAGIAEQVQGMSDAAQAAGFQLLLVQGMFEEASEEQAIRALLGWQPAGLILQAFVQSAAARALLRERGLPVMEISEIQGQDPIDMALGISNFETAHRMTCHLIERGYRRIGFVSTPVHGNDRLRQRRIGYRAALRDNGRRYVSRLDIEMPITLGGGTEAIRRLMAIRPAIDAVFFSSDTLAIGAVQECHRRGWRIPADVAIAGYGDIDLAEHLYPRLTTVRVDRHDMGRRAVERLIRRIRGDVDPMRITPMPFEIVTRETT